MRQILIALGFLVVSVPAFADDTAAFDRWEKHRIEYLNGPQKTLYCYYRGGGLHLKLDNTAKTVESPGGDAATIASYSEEEISGTLGGEAFTLKLLHYPEIAADDKEWDLTIGDGATAGSARCGVVIPPEL